MFFSDSIDNKFVDFSYSKYRDALNYIKDIISNKDSYDDKLVSYSEYLLDFLTNNKKFKLRKLKLKKIMEYNDTNN